MSRRVRFAPSPTGHLHLGNARTALFNWLFARHHGGVFILRIEDTDVERQHPGAEEAIYEDLSWLGLDWDEGPVAWTRAPAGPENPAGNEGRRENARGRTGGPGPRDRSRPGRSSRPAGGDRGRGGGAGSLASRSIGRHGPYRQSERGRFYAEAFARLLDLGAAYRCFCSDEDLEADRRASPAAGEAYGYSGRCAALAAAEAASRAAAGEPCALRFRVGRYGIVQDELRGSVDFRARPAFDPVIGRRDGRPTYNFAAVVDDAAMEITDVLRGEDHLTNTALQVRLYEELSLTPPRFAHLPLIHGPDGAPLSKRHGARSIEEMRAKGYPPEALVNSLALLGWTPPGDKLLLDREELIEHFDLHQVRPTPAIFDGARLDWISGQKIRSMDAAERGRRLGERLRLEGILEIEVDEAEGWLVGLGELLASSLTRFEQAREAARPFFEFDPEAALAAGAVECESARLALEAFARLIEERGGVEEGTVPDLVKAASRETGLKGYALLHPLRVAVTGRRSGPELARLLPLLEEGARLGVAAGVKGPASRIRQVLAPAP